MGGAVLMQHHAFHRGTLALLAVFAFALGFAHQSSLLQFLLYPCVAASPIVLAPVKAVEVFDVPSIVTTGVQIGEL